MASGLPLDTLRHILDHLPPVSRGRTIISSAEVHRALIADSCVWNRIWEDTGFYLQPQDRHQPIGKAISTRLDITKCHQAFVALNRPHAFESLYFRKIFGRPGWLTPDSSTWYDALTSFCNKQAGFAVTLKKSVSFQSFTDESILDDLFVDVSRLRDTNDPHYLPFFGTSELKISAVREHVRSQIHPVSHSSFVLYQNRRSVLRGSSSTLFQLDQSRPGHLRGDRSQRVADSADISTPPLGFKNTEIEFKIEILSRSSSLALVLQLFSYLRIEGSFAVQSEPFALV